MKKLTNYMMFLALVFPAGSLLANVESQCAGSQSDTEKCLYFFKGYLYGLGELSAQLEENKSSQESFRERAIRTRLGADYVNSSERKDIAGYCLPSELSVREIAKELQLLLSTKPLYWAEEPDPILKALQTSYPCQ
ncbi:Uncharacterised protein [Zhongshania aliphaticivorans]|uniref:Rap1a immunity protein domain-containing protein n=1 Tax=Zhongshania aliphaticivorans TaxID=1470434 RepID=A0A5S9PHW9_9GAMM|nr:Rap1a/Tai family immunity protein [Zhongshania aliphaticivorans]CAA0103690.1 Uncharacterised protein [Zhongshania aliphaticivorans]CAA0113335.1 Uncharacterised protein [Zhongshania aliphaticivorans]